MTYIFWAPLAAAVLHILEEFVFPGGFREWYSSYKPQIKKSISKRFLFLINAGLLILCYDIGALKENNSSISVILWLGVMALLAANGVWHLRGVLKTKTYSPGVVTGTIIYIPLAVYGYIYFLQTGLASILIAVAAFIVGASYQLWSNLFHRFRSAQQK
jgi:hypothetical protein